MSIRYLLDTNTCIYLINQRPKAVLHRFERVDVGQVGVSSITADELDFGVAKSRSERNRHALDKFLLPLESRRPLQAHVSLEETTA